MNLSEEEFIAANQEAMAIVMDHVSMPRPFLQAFVGMYGKLARSSLMHEKEKRDKAASKKKKPSVYTEFPHTGYWWSRPDPATKYEEEEDDGFSY